MYSTTIKLNKETKSELDRFREHKDESYDQVIRKMIYIANKCRKDPVLGQKAVKSIEQARERIKEGNFVSEKEAKERLGL